MRKRLVVVEGFDRTGKDTLIRSFLDKHSDAKQYIQPTSESVGISYRDVHAFEDYLSDHYREVVDNIIKMSKEESVNTIITTRLFVSDMAYSKLFERKYQFGPIAEEKELKKFCEPICFCILWKNYDEYLKRVAKCEDSVIEYSEKEFYELQGLFEDAMAKMGGGILWIEESTTREYILENLEDIVKRCAI